MAIVGIDPGLEGAIAILRGAEPSVVPMPTRLISAARAELDAQQLAAIVQAARPALAVIEDVGASPRFGASRAFTFGKVFGQTLAVLELSGCPILRVRPGEWKKSQLAGTDRSKAAAIAKVKFLFPRLSLLFPGKKTDSHDAAEAVLLAQHGQYVARGVVSDPSPMGEAACTS